MSTGTMTQKQLSLCLLALLALLLIATLLWSNSAPDGLFGAAYNTTGTVVASSECGARRSDVCVELELNHEIVSADTNGISTTVGDRVYTQVNDDLSRALILSVLGS
ncbi:MAG: hypothetical protein R3C14_37140 [Caldilineaceae bacterium]